MKFKNLYDSQETEDIVLIGGHEVVEKLFTSKSFSFLDNLQKKIEYKIEK